MTEPLDLALPELAAAYREGSLRAAAVVEAAIARHDTYGHDLGAYIDWAPDFARRQAAAADAYLAAGASPGPLFGVPVSVKDLFGVAGFRTRAGSPRALPPTWEREGPMVGAVRAQLGIITGKTHTVEFAYGGLGANPHWPVPRNPWDMTVHRMPGGSSSGAGVTLVEGSALIAFGSDTGGSVRIPASVTGTVGLKTSVGRWSLDGIVPLSRSLDTAGILTRTAVDAAYAFAAFDPAWGDPLAFFDALPLLGPSDLTIGVAAGTYFWDDCAPGVAEAVQTALDELGNAGARTVDLALPETAEAYDLFASGGVVSPELYAFLQEHLPDWFESLDPIVARRIGPAGEMSAAEYLRRLDRIAALGRSASDRLRDFDVLATPTVAITPPTTEDIRDLDGYRRNNLMILRNTAVVNYLGLCAITLPVGLDAAGMPVGMQLIARPGDEESLLAVVLACERCLGTAAERIGIAPARLR